MKIRILSFITVLSAVLSGLSAQSAIGSWQTHLAYGNIQFAVPASKRVYALASGGLFSYDTEDNSIVTYDKATLLNDQTISFIDYCKQAKCLAIVYSNLNIDLLYDNEKVYNISSYMDKPMSQDKTVNKVNSFGNQVYICTNFGIVVIDAQKVQVANTYILEKKVYACAIKNNVIYAITDKGLVAGDLNDNLLEASNWKEINTTVYKNILLYDNHLFLFKGNDGIYLFDENSLTYTLSASGNYVTSSCSDGKMIATNGYMLRVYTSHDQSYYWRWPNGQSYPYFHSICSLDNLYYFCNGTEGLNTYTFNTSTETPILTLQENLSSPNGPIRNLAAFMREDNNRILVCGGGSWTDRFYNQGTIMQYKDGAWTAFQESGIKDITGVDYRDISTIAVNPKDSSHYFASSIGEGIYEFKSGKFVEQYTYKNSTLNHIANHNPNTFMRISGLNFDKYGNLWALNMGVDTIMKVRTAEGKWLSLFYPEIKGWGAPNRTLIDSRGWIWAACMINYNGVFCIDTKGTLENTSDDRTMLRSSYTNQDGTAVSGDNESLRIFALAEDRDGAIWIGSARGPLVVSNPSKWFDSDFRITQVKIPRNDGTNLADYLLAGERINAIAIDGGNRKWLGTQSNGIYLVSADGVEEIHHFTTANSPLLSNTIQSIAILPTTGEVFIGTDKGIISYQSDATEAESSFSSDVHAFPNPVRSDYTGPISVKGLVYDSDVKIVDAGGHLVYEGRSTGGMFSWDGRNMNGDRVASGVYMVLAADSEGKEGVVTKIVIIR